MPTRSKKEVNRYRKALKTQQYKVCVFCTIKDEPERIVQEFKNFYVVKNKFPYSNWDSQQVLEHLMVLPKKHTDTVSDFNSYESIEYLNIISSYESRGYNIYSRAAQSTMKSIVHQHTHLIKTSKRTSKFIIFIRKPYFRIIR